MSMFAEYVKERMNDEIIENEKGFITFNFLDDKSVYIKDLYINPDFRKTGAAKEFQNEVIKMAKEKGIKEIVGTVAPSTNNSHLNLKLLMADGFVLRNCINDLIVLRKEI